MNLFDEIKPIYYIDNEMDNILNAINEIADITNVNARTIKRNFKILIDNSVIERVGSDKTGYWQIIK